MKVKLETIATRLKLSEATVSRALRNHSGISNETRTAVLDAANELGYKVSYAHKGRKLPEKSSLNVVALVSGDSSIDSATWLTHDILKGISDVLNADEGRLIIDFVGSRNETTAELVGRCAAGDGVVFVHKFDESAVRAIAAEVPCVSADYKYDVRNVDTVSGEDIENMSYLVRYLQMHGHRQIGYVDFPSQSPHPRGDYRYLGFLAGIIRNRVARSGDEIDLTNVKFTEESAKYAAALELVKQKKVTAWVCGNDYSAFNLINYLLQNGIRIPDDVSVTGFGGVSFPNFSLPLCTFKMPFEEIGRESVKHLIDRISHPNISARQIFIDCEFVKGETVDKVKRETD